MRLDIPHTTACVSTHLSTESSKSSSLAGVGDATEGNFFDLRGDLSPAWIFDDNAEWKNRIIMSI